MFPRIDLEMAYAWAGTFGETKDGLAYIGEMREFPRTYFALATGEWHYLRRHCGANPHGSVPGTP